ncbi:MAG: hypothetical protein JNM31_06045 [Flavobacteriales bacterium]|nr:hypothetical protein [Flavobacteriales bacterium]
MPATEEKRCLECGEPLRGRTDKRFCSDGCRNLHHYRINNAPINYVRNVVNALKRNRRVLAELNNGPEGKTKVHRDRLLEHGFNFMYHTHVHRTRMGNTYIFCFEQGYLELSENWFMLVRRDEYLERSGDSSARSGAGSAGRPDEQHGHRDTDQGE